MNSINKTEKFSQWLTALKDIKGKARILARIRKASLGHFGDAAPVGDGVFEMRIHYGPGYRVYYAREERTIYLLLTGGDKSTQARDIKTAIAMWKRIKKELL